MDGIDLTLKRIFQRRGIITIRYSHKLESDISNMVAPFIKKSGSCTFVKMKKTLENTVLSSGCSRTDEQ